MTIESCTDSSLKLTLEGGTDEGIIYIQGQDAICRQPTLATTALHTFDFVACNIQWVRTLPNLFILYLQTIDKQYELIRSTKNGMKIET